MDRYRERATMAGYADEAYYSLYRLGVLRLAEGDGLTVLLEAWQRCPHRWEPVHEAARWLNQRGLYQASYALSKQALAHSASRPWPTPPSHRACSFPAMYTTTCCSSSTVFPLTTGAMTRRVWTPVTPSWPGRCPRTSMRPCGAIWSFRSKGWLGWRPQHPARGSMTSRFLRPSTPNDFGGVVVRVPAPAVRVRQATAEVAQIVVPFRSEHKIPVVSSCATAEPQAPEDRPAQLSQSSQPAPASATCGPGVAKRARIVAWKSRCP